MKSSRLLTLGCSSIALVAFSGSANAQIARASAPADATSNEDGQRSSGIADIVVTAQKRSESVQKVPASVSVLSAGTLATRRLDDLSDIAKQVPSLVIGKLFGSNLITLRGISTGLTSGTEDPSVAVHVDGVYQPRTRSLDVILADVERVEVLAGPQGTLYGRNATGGVINYVLKEPQKEFGAGISGLAANYDRYAVRAYVTGPLAEGIEFRLSGIYDDQSKGFTKNLLPNAPEKTLESNRVAGGRAAIKFDPSSAFSMTLEGTYTDSRGKPLFSSFSVPGAPFTDLYVPLTTAPHEVYSEHVSALNSKIYTGTLTANYQFNDDVSLKSITGYQKYKDFMAIDSDASGYTGVDTNNLLKSNTFTEELDLSVNMFDNRLKSIYGFFYFNDKITEDNHVNFGGAIPNVIIPIEYFTAQRAKSFAFFTDQTFSVTDKLRLRAGARYSSDRKSVEQFQDFAGSVCTYNDKYKNDQFSPLLAVT